MSAYTNSLAHLAELICRSKHEVRENRYTDRDQNAVITAITRLARSSVLGQKFEYSLRVRELHEERKSSDIGAYDLDS
jgi:hypothetical protein